MPIYSYICKNCNNVFDELIRKPDDEPSFCKYCASASIERTITAHGGIQGSFGTVHKKNAGSYKRK